MHLKDATLLIVDDEVALLGIFRGWFEREGCRVFTAENGAQALDIATANDVDAIVSDVRMPVLDGIGLAKHLKERNGYIPKIIFVSGFSDIGDRDCFDLGVEAILAKPIKRPALVDTVRRSLSDRAALWEEPSALSPTAKLNAVFPSLLSAQQQEMIAFGRGGFCLRSTLGTQLNNLVALHLQFEADRLSLIGQGIVRWIDYPSGEIGIEIVHVESAHRAWVADLAEHNRLASFIPRTTSPQVELDVNSIGQRARDC